MVRHFCLLSTNVATSICNKIYIYLSPRNPYLCPQLITHEVDLTLCIAAAGGDNPGAGTAPAGAHFVLPQHQGRNREGKPGLYDQPGQFQGADKDAPRRRLPHDPAGPAVRLPDKGDGVAAEAGDVDV